MAKITQPSQGNRSAAVGKEAPASRAAGNVGNTLPTEQRPTVNFTKLPGVK